MVLVGIGGQDGLDGLAAVLGHEAGERAVGLLDGAAGRHRARRGDAGDLQGERIGHREMAAGADQIDRVVRGRHVQLGAVGMAADVELRIIIAAGEDPFAGLLLRGGLADEVEQAVERVRLVGAGVDLGHGEAHGQEMGMGLEQAGRGEPAAQFDDAGAGADQRLHVGGRADGEDLARPERDGLGHRPHRRRRHGRPATPRRPSATSPSNTPQPINAQHRGMPKFAPATCWSDGHTSGRRGGFVSPQR